MGMKKIFLLADDDVDDKELFSDVLKAIDPMVVCYYAENGHEVFDVLSTRKLPDLILLDINMPRMNGWQCLKKLKQSEYYRHIPVLMYSTSSNQNDINTALDLGALCFFSKPNTYSELSSILETIIKNMDVDLLDAIGHFNHIKAKRVFACTTEE
jgi:CheY-like chemotaxis protein